MKLMQKTSPNSVKNTALLRLLDLIEARGFDCAGFRQSYIERRIGSRLRATGQADYLNYARYLRRNEEEYVHLFNALTINVTQFFRDAHVFEVLEEEIFPQIIESVASRNHKLIRVWSAGCAAGQEPYTVAMIMAKCLEKAGIDLHCSIHGTDIDEVSINVGRRAEYPMSEVKNIPAHYQKYLVRKGPATFTFKPRILQMVKLKKADLFVDKPIKHVEVVLCRNVLIYFTREQQRELVNKVHESICQRGFLIIGKSEKLNADRDAFVVSNTVCRIYSKLADPGC